MRASQTCLVCLSLLLAAGCQSKMGASSARTPGLMQYTKPSMMSHAPFRVYPITPPSKTLKPTPPPKESKPIKLPVPFEQDPADGQSATLPGQ